MFEEIDNTKNGKSSLAILVVFVLIATIVGVAVAAYTWRFSGQTNTISTGNISMSYLESKDTIDITNALPMSDTAGKAMNADNEMFDFAVSTFASGAPGNITYTISITKAAVDTGYTSFLNSEVKVYLTAVDNSTETQVMAPTLASNILSAETVGTTGNLTFDSGKTNYLTHDHTTANTTNTQIYRLRMWVDGDVDASNWTASTKKQYKLKVNVNGGLS